MDVIVTMAGHSRRFGSAGLEGPKALLTVGDRPMIQHVLDAFAPDDRFHVVVNEEQVAADPALPGKLEALAAQLSVTVVPGHEQGPILSALAVQGLADSAEVFITYCDLAVAWDRDRFLRDARGHAGAVASFRGFSPASLGDTLYAYMRVQDGRMQELREKACFTDDRASEHASVGIYWFDRWDRFCELGIHRLAAGPPPELSEPYVSLLMNDLVAEGLSVAVHEVERFACLGTPGDCAQFQHWWRYFEGPAPSRPEPSAGANLLPMAGAGRRFAEVGYEGPKPLIEVRGEPMLLRAARALPPAERWVFELRAQDLERADIDDALDRVAPNGRVVRVDRPTTGQAATCLLAEAELDLDAELLIASCDYESLFSAEAWNALRADPSVDGAIWTWRAGGAQLKDARAFAYCRGQGARVTEVVEKQTISTDPGADPLVVGTFWYRRARDFVRGARAMIDAGVTVQGEHYVGTSINQLIAEGQRWVVFEVDSWISFGDPFELQVLEWWQGWFEG